MLLTSSNAGDNLNASQFMSKQTEFWFYQICTRNQNIASMLGFLEFTVTYLSFYLID